MEALTARRGEVFPYMLHSLASVFQIYDAQGAHAGEILTQELAKQLGVGEWEWWGIQCVKILSVELLLDSNY